MRLNGIDRSTPGDRWLLPIRRSRRPLLRLFCFPCAGGWGQMYYPWAQRLSMDIDVWAIQLPGRASRVREAACTCMCDISEQVARAIRPHLNVPFAFFGHSMGALISFEVSRRLRSLCWERPRHLFLSGSMAPNLCHLRPALNTLSDEEIKAKLAYWNSTPEELTDNDELLGIVLPALRSDFLVCDTYTYTDEDPLDIPMTVFGGDGDEEVPLESLAAWKRHTAGHFALRTFPGGHFYFRSVWDEFFAVLREQIGHIITRQTKEALQ